MIHLKKLYALLISLLLLFSLVSCDKGYDKLEYYIGDYQVYQLYHGDCEMYVKTRIYEDEDNIYYLGASGCTASEYYFIKVDNDFIGIGTAIMRDIISIDDVIDSNIPFLVIEDNTDE